jgi:hypothetical protein
MSSERQRVLRKEIAEILKPAKAKRYMREAR